tara:strand:+ start:6288 stop:6701 length:414 start_codon:yes stop_codon:yes gene_type:complete
MVNNNKNLKTKSCNNPIFIVLIIGVLFFILKNKNKSLEPLNNMTKFKFWYPEGPKYTIMSEGFIKNQIIKKLKITVGSTLFYRGNSVQVTHIGNGQPYENNPIKNRQVNVKYLTFSNALEAPYGSEVYVGDLKARRR